MPQKRKSNGVGQQHQVVVMPPKMNLDISVGTLPSTNPFLSPPIFQILTVTASDGVEISPEPMQQLERSIRFCRQLQSTDPRHVDWRRKLAAELTPYTSHPGTPAELAHLPAGYALWEEGEYVNGKPLGCDLIFLYGHPLGIGKRFGSVETFLPHLRWIVAGMVPGKCTCRSCNQYYVGDEHPTGMSF